MDRHKMHACVAHILSVMLSASLAWAEPPSLTFFYGKHLTFRSIGVPQRCANILGNVQDEDGINSLTCSINGGPERALSLGPDTRRLLNTGDFNIDIPWPELLPLPDSNIVVITATDVVAEVQQDTVVVCYTEGTQWPFPTSVDWEGLTVLTEAAQVVDGQWAIEGSSVRNLDIGYDRLLAIGDTTWTDYEVTVPITIHSIDSGGYNPVSGRPTVGIFVRWVGHTDDPIFGWQPLTGWNPSGALGMYAFNTEAGGGERLEIWQDAIDESGKTLSFGVTYVFKMRVESLAEGDHYALRVWPEGESEPTKWDVVYLDETRRASHGSALLLAHHVDATFGNVEVGTPSELPVELAGFTAVALAENRVQLSWRTLSEVSNYGFEVERAAVEPVGFTAVAGGFVAGHQTTLEPHDYAFVDTTVSQGIWYYRLRQIDLDGTITHHEPVRIVVSGTAAVTEADAPSAFELLQNYPNPFNPKTVVSCQSPVASYLRLAVYDLLGREVAVLIDEHKGPGTYQVEFDGAKLTSGVYICRMTVGSFVESREMLLVK